jgi:CheY-like chemotaxis protein
MTFRRQCNHKGNQKGRPSPGGGYGGSHKMKFILVDDSPTTRNIQKRALASLGHDVIEANHGVKALELHNTDESDLMIVNWNMPNAGNRLLTKTAGRRHLHVRLDVTDGHQWQRI